MMRDTYLFNRNFEKVINKCAYDFFLVSRDENAKCLCLNHTTSQGDPECKKCLGTGYKITIRKVRGASQETELPTTFRNSNFGIARVFYLKDKYLIDKDDYIVDNNEVYIILEVQSIYSLEGTVPILKISAVRKKFDSKIVINNFNSIIKGK